MHNIDRENLEPMSTALLYCKEDTLLSLCQLWIVFETLGNKSHLTLKDICFPDTTPKISFKIHFKHEYVLNLLWLYSKEV